METLALSAVDGRNGARILRLNGPLTLRTLFEFQDLARRENSAPLILDLTDVPFMNSAGLGAILGLYASSQRKQHPFALAGICARVRTLFAVARIDGLLPTYVSAEDAEAAIGAS